MPMDIHNYLQKLFHVNKCMHLGWPVFISLLGSLHRGMQQKFGYPCTEATEAHFLTQKSRLQSRFQVCDPTGFQLATSLLGEKEHLKLDSCVKSEPVWLPYPCATRYADFIGFCDEPHFNIITLSFRCRHWCCLKFDAKFSTFSTTVPCERIGPLFFLYYSANITNFSQNNKVRHR